MRISRCLTAAAMALVALIAAAPPAGAAPIAAPAVAATVATPGWYMLVDNLWYPELLENAPMWSAKPWCLSRNVTMPQGGTSGEYSAYTAQCSTSTSYQSWQTAELSANIITVQNFNATAANKICLSGKSANPLPGGVWRVFTEKCTSAGPQVWRPWAPTSFVR